MPQKNHLIILAFCLISFGIFSISSAEQGQWTFNTDPGFLETHGGTDTNFQWSIADGMLNLTMTREAKLQRVYMPLSRTYGNGDTLRLRARFRILNNQNASIFYGFFDKNDTTNISNGGDHVNLEFYSNISHPGGYGAAHYDHGSLTVMNNTWYILEMSFRAYDSTYRQSIYDDTGVLLAQITPSTSGVNHGVNAIGFCNYNESQASTYENVQFDWVSWSVNEALPADPPLPPIVIKDVFPIADSNKLSTTVKLYRPGSPSKNVLIRCRAYQDQIVDSNHLFLEDSSGTITIPAGGTTLWQHTLTSLNPKLWSPKSPNLYLLRTDILDADNLNNILTTQDVVIGFRTLKVVGKNLHLNDKPIYLCALAMTPPYRTPPSMYNDPNFINQHVQRLKDSHINMVRLDGGPDAWYQAFDKAGIMCAAGCYSGSGSNDANSIYINNSADMNQIVPLYRNHPSIVMWYTANEVDVDAAGMKTTLVNLYNLVKSMDPSRLIFAAQGYGGNPAVDGQDFYDAHNYNGWYNALAYNWYANASSYSAMNVPVTLTECIGAYTGYDANNPGFVLNFDSLLGNAVRFTGDSYKYGQESLDYQAYLTRIVTELCRRNRGVNSSLCGVYPFTNAYLYDYTNGTETAKPMISELAKSYEPVHVSIESLQPHVFAGNSLAVSYYILNDDPNYYPSLPATTLYVDLLDRNGTSVWNTSYPIASVNYYATQTQSGNFTVPAGLTAGDYKLQARLNNGSIDLSSDSVSILVGRLSHVQIRKTPSSPIAVYDTQTNNPTIIALNLLGVPTIEIFSFNSLSSYPALIIGRDSFNITVAAAETSILSFIQSGKRVLILEQNSSGSRSAFNSSTWLGTAVTLRSSTIQPYWSDDFVNMTRPQISTLMNGLSRDDFRYWNLRSFVSNFPKTQPYEYWLEITYSDLDKVAVLGNADQHLIQDVLLEIFPVSPTGPSCILSQFVTVERVATDPVAANVLANLVDYTIEGTQHHQYVDFYCQPIIKFGSNNFESEKGILPAPLLQGLIIHGFDDDYHNNPAGVTARGWMTVDSGWAYISPSDTATSWKCPLYLRTDYTIGGSTPVTVDVQNTYSIALSYRLFFNGVAASPGWTSVGAGQRLQQGFTITSEIASNTDIKLEIEFQEGQHIYKGDPAYNGLIFYSVRLTPGVAADFDYNCKIDFFDFAQFAEHWEIEESTNYDLNGDNLINWPDIYYFVTDWLDEY